MKLPIIWQAIKCLHDWLLLVAGRLFEEILVDLTDYGGKVKGYNSRRGLIGDGLHYKLNMQVIETGSLSSPCIQNLMYQSCVGEQTRLSDNNSTFTAQFDYFHTRYYIHSARSAWWMVVRRYMRQKVSNKKISTRQVINYQCKQVKIF